MSKKKKIVLIIAVVLLIGAGVGYYFYNKKKQDSTPFALANAAYLELLGRPLNPDVNDSGTKWAMGIVEKDGIEALKSHIKHSEEFKAKAA